jgi:hypothetical protein
MYSATTRLAKSTRLMPTLMIIGRGGGSADRSQYGESGEQLGGLFILIFSCRCGGQDGDMHGFDHQKSYFEHWLKVSTRR